MLARGVSTGRWPKTACLKIPFQEDNLISKGVEQLTTVAVAMSGGVDSSAAACLLKQAGHKIFGITMLLWDKDLAREKLSPETPGRIKLHTVKEDPAAKDLKKKESKSDGAVLLEETAAAALPAAGSSGAGRAALEARQVADRLGFPHYTLDLRPAFQELVIQNFVQEYLQGRTPNPCIVCNRYVKFGWLLAQARALGADYLATGHYARIQRDEKSQRFVILKGVDPRKDQSYFLYRLTQEQLSQVLFPLGLFQKDKIRNIVRDLGLNNADQPESQEICFIENNDYRDFLRKRVPLGIKPGPFLDQQGEVLGQHQGLPFYTVGQRKGLGLALGQPMYVVRIDPERNAVILGTDEQLLSQQVWTENNNFFPFADLEKPTGVTAKIRSTAKPAAATIIPASGQQVVVEFAEPQRAVTPGQAIVYYQGESVVGGGTIIRAE